MTVFLLGYYFMVRVDSDILWYKVCTAPEGKEALVLHP